MPRVDAHLHVIDPLRHPFVPGCGYHPQDPVEWGTSAQLDVMMAARGVSHGLLVQPSCYGTDNRAMLDAIRRGDGRLRGIAVIDPEISEAGLDELAASGIVGVRLNLEQSGGQALANPSFERLIERLRRRGWFVEVFAAHHRWQEMAPMLASFRIPVIVDHWAGVDSGQGPGQAGFQAVLEAARACGDWTVKLSAPFRISRRPPPYEDLDPFLPPLIDAFGLQGCLWGSDWPFINTPNRIEAAGLDAAFDRWFPRPAERQQITWDTPARLFGFASRG